MPSLPTHHRGAHIRHFGITDNTGKPKPPLHELAAFADILSTADFDRCERTDAQAALVVTEFLERGYPFSPTTTYRSSSARCSRHTWPRGAARRTGGGSSGSSASTTRKPR